MSGILKARMVWMNNIGFWRVLIRRQESPTECSARIFAPYSDIKLPNPPCSHTFAFRAKGIDVTFRLGYSRHRLYDWHKIEEQAIKTILAFAEAADKDIAANAHHKQQEAKNEAVDAARY